MKHRLVSTAAILLLLALAAACAPASPAPANATPASAATAAAPEQPAAEYGQRVEAPGGSYQLITPEELHAMLEHKDFVLINVQTPTEQVIESTDYVIDYLALPQNLAKIPDREASVVLYCADGERSGKAARKLVSFGYTRVYDLEGGMAAWEAAGYPLVPSEP